MIWQQIPSQWTGMRASTSYPNCGNMNDRGFLGLTRIQELGRFFAQVNDPPIG